MQSANAAGFLFGLKTFSFRVYDWDHSPINATGKKPQTSELSSHIRNYCHYGLNAACHSHPPSPTPVCKSLPKKGRTHSHAHYIPGLLLQLQILFYFFNSNNLLTR